ncbi:MAG: hypothetical protein KF878_01720 [Planctomycetes bacterium]|nr:hypothetical protein [Planctomycetota bacterium]
MTELVVRRAPLVAAALSLVALAAAAQDEGGFQDHTLRFAGALQAAGEPGLAALEAWDPARDPPGALSDVARRVAALPLGPDAPARLAALVGRADPFLQEAGLVVARGQVEQGLVQGVAEAVAAPAARAVRAERRPVGGPGRRREPSTPPARRWSRCSPPWPTRPARGPSPIDATRAGPASSRMRPVTGGPTRLDATLGRWLGPRPAPRTRRCWRTSSAAMARVGSRPPAAGAPRRRHPARAWPWPRATAGAGLGARAGAGLAEERAARRRGRAAGRRHRGVTAQRVSKPADRAPPRRVELQGRRRPGATGGRTSAARRPARP